MHWRGGLANGAAFAQDNAIRFIVGFSPGGGFDMYARLLARHYGRHLPGNPNIIVQNMPGSSSLKAVQYLDQGARRTAITSRHSIPA